MKKSKALLVGTVLAASTVASNVAVAELSGNAGFTSNYIWRGVTQSSDISAISGGIDYAHDSGFYAGTWVSSLDGGQFEQDYYAGFGFDAGPVGLDVGYIMYTYPVDDTVELDFEEAYINASYEMLTVGVAMTTGYEATTQYEDDMYMYVGAEFDVKDGLMLGLTYGDYDFDDPTSVDYSHYQVSLSKSDFVFAYDKNDQDGPAGDARFTVSYSKSFDL